MREMVIFEKEVKYYLHTTLGSITTNGKIGENAKENDNIRLRFLIVGMICLASMINYIVRGNMSIIILAMTKPLYNTSDAIIPDYGPRYEWSAYDQSLVIGSFFWGSVSITFLAGILAERLGPRNVVGTGIILAAIFSAVAPVAANYLWLSILVRFFTGVSMGAVSPSMQALIANWAPPEERGKFLSAFLANGIGTVIDWSMSGFIIEYLGWDYAFYVVVLILGVFAIAWFSIIYDSPINHPRITIQEKEFILSKLNTTAIKKRPWPPLKSMLLSIPFWALVLFHFGCLFSSYVFLTATPKYLSEVHHFDIASTGILSSIPYLARFIFGICFGIIGDFLFKRKLMTSTATRKYFSICSHFLPASFLIGLSFIGNRPYLSITFISMALGLSGSMSITSLQNPHDLSPNFATTIYAFMHTIGSTPGFIAPLVVAHFTKERSTDAEWRYVFLIGAGILIGTAAIFILFGSAKTQKWNDLKEDVDDEDKTHDLPFDISSKFSFDKMANTKSI